MHCNLSVSLNLQLNYIKDLVPPQDNSFQSFSRSCNCPVICIVFPCEGKQSSRYFVVSSDHSDHRIMFSPLPPLIWTKLQINRLPTVRNIELIPHDWVDFYWEKQIYCLVVSLKICCRAVRLINDWILKKRRKVISLFILIFRPLHLYVNFSTLVDHLE